MTKTNSFDYFDTKCVENFKKLFFANFHLKSQDSREDKRNYFFNYFAKNDFRKIYENLALELADKFEISEKDFLIQNRPTPRVCSPGAHGTNWHTDYWYGHGK